MPLQCGRSALLVQAPLLGALLLGALLLGALLLGALLLGAPLLAALLMRALLVRARWCVASGLLVVLPPPLVPPTVRRGPSQHPLAGHLAVLPLPIVLVSAALPGAGAASVPRLGTREDLPVAIARCGYHDSVVGKGR
jgi:hypothetical protein